MRVFFAPLEYTENRDHYNQAIASALCEAGIKVVLLDRCFAPYPYRSNFDLVGIDNRAAGFIITDHLLKLGCTRPVFLSRYRSASTVQGRIAGFNEALRARSVRFEQERTRRG